MFSTFSEDINFSSVLTLMNLQKNIINIKENINWR